MIMLELPGALIEPDKTGPAAADPEITRCVPIDAVYVGPFAKGIRVARMGNEMRDPAGLSIEPIEGAWTPPRFVIVEFPNYEALRTWYSSPDYQEALKLRQAAARLTSDGKNTDHDGSPGSKGSPPAPAAELTHLGQGVGGPARCNSLGMPRGWLLAGRWPGT